MGDFKESIYQIGNIKSVYIIKGLFLFLYENQKLNLIIYNKQLQKKLGIDIKYYKKLSGKYRIGEKNGKGREYSLNEDKLIFEGEYLNGKRNGKGKEYNYFTDKIRFEGEYLNGKEWNGKSYNGNNEIECEVKNGMEKLINIYMGD